MRLLAIIAAMSFVSCVNVKEYASDLLKKSLQDKYLKAHNEVRKSKGLNPLSWDESLEDMSKGAAENMAKDCRSKAKPRLDAIYQSWGNLITTPKDVINSWVRVKGGAYKNIVYEHTIAVGCGYAICKDPKSLSNSVIHVCNYKYKPLLERILK